MLRRALAMGLTPVAFWRLSWREWAMLHPEPVQQSPPRAVLDEMMRLYPDGDDNV